jgi:dynein heavy chain
MGLPTKLYTLNPKACSVIELYGFLDTTTRDWTDGLLSNIFREINKPTDKKERRYILYDGDVDALWIENMVCYNFEYFLELINFFFYRILLWMIINF